MRARLPRQPQGWALLHRSIAAEQSKSGHRQSAAATACPLGYRASQHKRRAARNTDERGVSPSQTATGTMDRLHFQVSYKKLERGRFIWPSPADGVITITSAQLGYLLEGIDWRMPQKTWRPTATG